MPCGQQKLAVDVVAAHLRHPSHWTAAKDLSIYDGKSKEAPMGILNTLLRAVTWWNGQTIGTQVFTWRRGERVGEDSQGNVFYRTRDDAKRWVIYNGEAEASRVDPSRWAQRGAGRRGGLLFPRQIKSSLRRAAMRATPHETQQSVASSRHPTRHTRRPDSIRRVR